MNTSKLPDELSLAPYTTRYGLNIPPSSLSRQDWQQLMGILNESEERVHFWKADMLYHAQQNFVVDKRDGKTIRQRLLWQDVYTEKEVAGFTPEQREEFKFFRRIQVAEIAAMCNLKPQTINNYLRVVRTWTLQRREEFDLSVISFADFERACSQSSQDVPYETQRRILLDIQAQRITILQGSEPDTIEAELPKTNAVLIQVQAAKAVHKTTGSSSGLSFYPDKRFARPLASREELATLLGNDIGKLPDGDDVIGYTCEIKVWAIRREEHSDDE